MNPFWSAGQGRPLVGKEAAAQGSEGRIFQAEELEADPEEGLTSPGGSETCAGRGWRGRGWRTSPAGRPGRLRADRDGKPRGGSRSDLPSPRAPRTTGWECTAGVGVEEAGDGEAFLPKERENGGRGRGWGGSRDARGGASSLSCGGADSPRALWSRNTGAIRGVQVFG